MKSFLVLIALSTISLTAFAYEGCYRAITNAPKSVPSTFCLESAQLDDNHTNLIISGPSLNLPASLKITSTQHVVGDVVAFTAESTLVNIWNTGCGDGERAILKIKGTSELDPNQVINPKELNVSVDYFATNDTCHSQTYSQTIVYVLKN